MLALAPLLRLGLERGRLLAHGIELLRRGVQKYARHPLDLSTNRRLHFIAASRQHAHSVDGDHCGNELAVAVKADDRVLFVRHTQRLSEICTRLRCRKHLFLDLFLGDAGNLLLHETHSPSKKSSPKIDLPPRTKIVSIGPMVSIQIGMKSGKNK